MEREGGGEGGMGREGGRRDGGRDGEGGRELQLFVPKVL